MFGFCSEEENPFGPVHEYVAPTILLAVKFNVLPAQIGELLPAVGAPGVGLTVTVTVPVALLHPLTVTVSEYVPPAASATLVMEGFCKPDENPFGPVHEYVAPATALVVRFKVLPVQTGLLLEGVGVDGIGFTVTVTVPAGPVHPPTVAVTE